MDNQWILLVQSQSKRFMWSFSCLLLWIEKINSPSYEVLWVSMAFMTELLWRCLGRSLLHAEDMLKKLWQEMLDRSSRHLVFIQLSHSAFSFGICLLLLCSSCKESMNTFYVCDVLWTCLMGMRLHYVLQMDSRTTCMEAQMRGMVTCII